jgi:hypothetical protein
MKHTKKCIRCFKPAKFHGGHVLKGKESIIAGWCSKRCSEKAGFRGHWKKEMGTQGERP